MNKTSDKFFCTLVCLVVASLAGFAAMAALIMVGGWSVMQALFAAAVVWAVLSALLITMICNGSRETPEEARARVETEMAEAKARATGASIPTATKPAAASPSPAVAASEPTPEPAAPAPTPKVSETPASAATSGPDDLKLLKGVGPKLENKLHANGVTSFAQIAGWGPAEIADMDDKLSFKGRIDRDGWVEQAKILASGGETEFSKRGEGKNG